MRRHLLGLCTLFALVAFLPAYAADDKKDEKKTDQAKLPKDEKQAFDKTVTAGELTGKLVQWGEGSQKNLTLQMTIKYQVPNQGALNNLVNLRNQAIEASRDASPANRVKRLTEIQVEIAKNQANAIQTKEAHKNIDLQVSDDMKVRVMQAPTLLDDKGKPRKPTAKELKEMKGPDPKLPGYTAELEALHQDQYVTVYLAKKKSTAKPATKDKDDKLTDDRPQIAMIVILAEPPPSK